MDLQEAIKTLDFYRKNYFNTVSEIGEAVNTILNEVKPKCKNEMRPQGDDFVEVDGCVYEEQERIENCTVIVGKCVNCGHVDWGWIK